MDPLAIYRNVTVSIKQDSVPDVATLMLETGARPEEIFPLKCENINLGQDYLTASFGMTKASRRKIPLTARVSDVVEKRMAEAEGDYIFAGGRGWDDRSRPIVKLNNAYYGALKRAKKVNASFKDSTFGTPLQPRPPKLALSGHTGGHI